MAVLNDCWKGTRMRVRHLAHVEKSFVRESDEMNIVVEADFVVRRRRLSSVCLCHLKDMRNKSLDIGTLLSNKSYGIVGNTKHEIILTAKKWNSPLATNKKSLI